MTINCQYRTAVLKILCAAVAYLLIALSILAASRIAPLPKDHWSMWNRRPERKGALQQIPVCPNQGAGHEKFSRQ